MSKAKDINMEVMKVHNLFWESYANRDIELRFSLCSEEVTFIGSGLHERALNKAEYKNINKEGVKQFPNPFQIEFLWTNLSMINEIVACVESEVVWSQMINNEISTELLRNTTLLKYDNNKWLVTHVHGSVPDYRLKEGDYMTNEQTIIRNKELERQVFERTHELNKTLEKLEGKNRELEIEASLEKVRTIAMGMREPADMLDVCKTISLQLQSLGVKEIRNVQTAIFYEQRGTYMNYEFYAKHDKTFITETVFTNNEIHNEFATKMMKGKGETFITHIKDYEVKEWIEYQKTTNVFIDKYLETASSLNYYWFSLGPVALGISTYIPLAEDEINLFKRFLKVFELAYQRYLDIEKAEAQAKEAKIEAALEKIRARALAMRNSSEVGNVSTLLFLELEKMNVNPSGFSIMIFDEVRDKYELWRAKEVTHQGAYETFSIKAMYDKFDKYVPGFSEELKTAWSKGNPFFIGEFRGENRDSFLQANREMASYSDEAFEEMKKDWPDPTFWHLVFFKYGWVGVLQNKQLIKEELLLIHRFAEVFDFAYTRFLDLQKAEAQAREAQIEAALERVRSRTMGMQKSEELKEVIRVVYEQFVNLKINVDHAGFVVNYTPKGDWYFWIADEQEIPSKITHPYFESVWANQFNEAKEKGADFFATNLNFEEKNKFYNELLSYVPGIPEASKDFYLSCPGLAATTVLFDNVSLYIENFSGTPYSDEENKILMRFGKVFQQTYTRFLDLQKAEAQAREANIETSLERVRSKAMAMHTTGDLSATVSAAFSELRKLGVETIRTGVALYSEDKPAPVFYASTTTEKDDALTIVGSHDPSSHTCLALQFDAWSQQQNYFPVLRGEELKSYYLALSLQPFLPKDNSEPFQHDEYGYYLPFSGGNFYVWSLKSCTENEISILSRFRAIIDLTFRRYFEIQNAEAQAREAQIEAALEKVRANALAMHKSEDFLSTALVVFNVLTDLGIRPIRSGLSVVLNEQKKEWEAWSVTKGIDDEKISTSARFTSAVHSVSENIFKHWKAQVPYWQIELSGEDLISFVKGMPREYVPMNNATGGLPFDTDRIVFHYFSFNRGVVFAGTQHSFSDEEVSIMKRFTSVFGFAYTRYLDLKKAEEQAREAKIEASLERVRSKAMSMHSPNDLSETVNVFFKELKILGIIPIRCGVGQIDKATRTTNLTTTTSSQQGDSFHVIGKVKQTGHPVLDGIFDHWELQKEYHPVLEGDDIKAYYNVMNAQIGYPEYPEEVTQYGNNFFFKEGFVFAWTENLLSEEELIIFRRFTLVLSLTYRRYLDLKEAEERNKIIQAENDRKTKELEEARQLQLSMLPKKLPQLPNLDIAVYMKTATEVGGDYYDFNVQENGVLNIGIGDATGHGLQAGTMITLMKGFFTSDVAKFNPKKFLEHCNGMIREIKLGRILMSFSHLRFENDSLLISSAGMPPIYYYHKKNNRTEEIIIQGLPLGAMGSSSYKLVEKQLNRGDTILLLTDGLPEQMNSHKVIFDYSRVLKYFGEIAENTPNEIINRLVQKADEWTDGQKQSDDITFVIIKVK